MFIYNINGEYDTGAKIRGKGKTHKLFILPSINRKLQLHISYIYVYIYIYINLTNNNCGVLTKHTH